LLFYLINNDKIKLSIWIFTKKCYIMFCKHK
jgi:hypothetical protein